MLMYLKRVYVTFSFAKLHHGKNKEPRVVQEMCIVLSVQLGEETF